MSTYNTNVESKWLGTKPGLIHLGLAIASALAMVASLFMPWFQLFDGEKVIFQMRGWASGLDFWVWMSIIAVPVSMLLSLRKPSLLGAVILGWFGSWWLLYSLAAITSGEAFRQAIDSVFHVADLILKQAKQENLVQTPDWLFQAGSVWYLVLVMALLLLAQSIWLLVQAHKNRSSFVSQVDLGTASDQSF